jgi:hypothetical protein
MGLGGKSENRNPKSEGSPKSEIRIHASDGGWEEKPHPCFGFRASDFLRISDFDFRISPL